MQLSGKGSACLIIGVLLAGGGVYVLIKYGIASAPIFLIAAVLIYLAFALGKDYSGEPAESVPASVSVTEPPVKKVVFERLPKSITYEGKEYDDKYHYTEVEYENIKPLALMTPVQFRLHDDCAEVIVDDEVCGRLTHGLFGRMLKDFSERNEPIAGRVDGENPNTLDLVFYRPHPVLEDYEQCKIESKVYSLAGTGTEEYEYMASITDPGDELDVIYDTERDRYETYAGYLPASANDFLGDNTVGFVESVDEHDNGRRIIKLRVFEEKL